MELSPSQPCWGAAVSCSTASWILTCRFQRMLRCFMCFALWRPPNCHQGHLGPIGPAPNRPSESESYPRKVLDRLKKLAQRREDVIRDRTTDCDETWCSTR